jgi:uncharacterized protein YodC (DUF2158 family)
MRFAIGDIVVLRSGGPRMTVKFIDDAGVHCIWFEASKSQTEIFHPSTLEPFVPTQQRFAITDYNPLDH